MSYLLENLNQDQNLELLTREFFLIKISKLLSWGMMRAS